MPRPRNSKIDLRFSLATSMAFAFLISRCVHAGGDVTLSPPSIVQSAVVNGQPTTLAITVTNNSSNLFKTPMAQGNSSCTELQSAAWLTLSTFEIDVGVSLTQTFTATINPAGLAAGSYSATICMLPAPIPVELTVTPIVYRNNALVDLIFQDSLQQRVSFQIQTPNIPIAAGDAQTYCYYFSMPNTSTAAVRHWLSHMDAGIQHAILFSTATAAAPDGTLTQNPCTTFPGQVSTWLYATHNADEDQVFPTSDGTGNPVALEIAAGQPAFLQIYLVNTTDQALTPMISITADALDPEQTYTKTAAYLTLNTAIIIPPETTDITVQNTCAVPADAKFWWLSTRTHHIATQSVVSDGSTDLQVSNDWADPSIALFSAPSFYQFSNGFTYSCTYDNDSAEEVRFGDSESADELCVGIGYFFPAPTGGKTCTNSAGPF
jgi:hypothetical protein